MKEVTIRIRPRELSPNDILIGKDKREWKFEYFTTIGNKAAVQLYGMQTSFPIRLSQLPSTILVRRLKET